MKILLFLMLATPANIQDTNSSRIAFLKQELEYKILDKEFKMRSDEVINAEIIKINKELEVLEGN